MNRSKSHLVKLLMELFSERELRNFVDSLSDESPPLASRLLANGAPWLDFATDTVELLARRGLVNPDFFQRLRDQRPLRQDDIAAAEALWVKSRASPKPSNTQPWRWLGPTAAVVAIVLLVLLRCTSGPTEQPACTGITVHEAAANLTEQGAREGFENEARRKSTTFEQAPEATALATVFFAAGATTHEPGAFLKVQVLAISKRTSRLRYRTKAASPHQGTVIHVVHHQPGAATEDLEFKELTHGPTRYREYTATEPQAGDFIFEFALYNDRALTTLPGEHFFFVEVSDYAKSNPVDHYFASAQPGHGVRLAHQKAWDFAPCPTHDDASFDSRTPTEAPPSTWPAPLRAATEDAIAYLNRHLPEIHERPGSPQATLWERSAAALQQQFGQRAFDDAFVTDHVADQRMDSAYILGGRAVL